MRLLFIMVTGISACMYAPSASSEAPDKQSWDNVPAFSLKGGLTAYWNVLDWSKGENRTAAGERGFGELNLVLTYADYPGKQAENIKIAMRGNKTNPWKKPEFFERTVRKNIAALAAKNDRVHYVHDIEFHFEQDAEKAWQDLEARKASGARTLAEFAVAYFREWATWFTLPLIWTKEMVPHAKVGLYGVQAFRRDFWGIEGQTAQQIDGTHARDWDLWQHIDQHVDFYVASIYVFYARPSSVFYMAANVEENLKRTRAFGDRPVLAYTWLRYHDSNRWEANRELDPYLVEAMALVPYFSGAKALVLWGHEPQIKIGSGQPYEQLPLFAKTLRRVAPLSAKIARGRLVLHPPAHELWNARKPLVRVVEVDQTAGKAPCVVLAINPWQQPSVKSTVTATCGGRGHEITVEGRRPTLAVIEDGRVDLH